MALMVRRSDGFRLGPDAHAMILRLASAFDSEWCVALLAAYLTASLASWQLPAEAQTKQLDVIWMQGHGRDVTEHRVYDSSPWQRGGPANTERRVVGASRASIDKLIESDLWPAEMEADTVEPSSLHIRAEDLRYGGGVHIEGVSGKQEQSLTMTNTTISSTTGIQSLFSYLCGSGGYCDDGAQLVGLSPSGSFAFASLNAYSGVGSRLWLFHDMEELRQTSERLVMDEIVGDVLAWKSLLSEDNINVLMPSVESVEPAAQAAISRFQLEREELVESGVLDTGTRQEMGLSSLLSH